MGKKLLNLSLYLLAVIIIAFASIGIYDTIRAASGDRVSYSNAAGTDVFRVTSDGGIISLGDLTLTDDAVLGDDVDVGGNITLSDVAASPKIYVTVTNNSGASVSNGDVVCWNASTTVVMGVSVDTTETAGNNYVAGVIAETIANGSNGLMQIWGYHSAIKNMEAGLNVTAGYDIITATRTGHGGGSATDNVGIGIWLDTKTSSGVAQGFLRGF